MITDKNDLSSLEPAQRGHISIQVYPHAFVDDFFSSIFDEIQGGLRWPNSYSWPAACCRASAKASPRPRWGRCWRPAGWRSPW